MSRISWPRGLCSAPHRLLFSAAGVQSTLLASGWAWACIAQAWHLPLHWATWPGPAHGLGMTLGVFPMFLAGFLFTAGPRWLKVTAPDTRDLVLATSAILGGWTLVWPGLHLHTPTAAAGLGLVTWGWAGLTRRFARLCRASRVPDRLHAHGLLTAMVLIAVASGGSGLSLLAGHPQGLRLSVQLGLWGGLATAFSFAAHRMTPFFHPPAWHRLQHGLLVPLLCALGLRGLVQAAQDLGHPIPEPARMACAVLWGSLAVVLQVAASGPELARARRAPMVGWLHRGWMWLSASLAMAALSSVPAVHTRLPGLDLASLHALTLGFMGTTLLTLASRVSAVHQGQTVALDTRAERLLKLLQVVIWLRVVAALWPQGTLTLTALAALGWAALLGGWSARWIPAFTRPPSSRRPSGR